MKFRILLTLIGCLIFPLVVHAQSVYQAHSELELITDAAAVTAQTPFWVGLRMKMDPEWHVYWKNPGDSGFAPLITWQLPSSLKAGNVQWPLPERINIGPLTSYGYEKEVILWSQIFPSDLPASGNVTIGAEVDWLTCKIECVPGKAKLMIILPISPKVQKNMEVSALLEKSRLLWPIDTKESVWSFSAAELPANFVIKIFPPFREAFLKDVVFFPESDRLIEHAVPQELKEEGKGYTLTLQKSHLITKPPTAIKGILVQEMGWDKNERYRAVTIDLPIKTVTTSAAGSASSTGILLSCLFAFIGGIILNLMPCVLPVLSLKVIGLVKSAGNRQKVVASGLVFTAGVVISFWILAGILIALQSVGAQLGWGFQFQSPVFVAFIASVLFIMALNFLGVYEIGLPLSLEAPRVSGYVGSFLSGVLATIVATPCTAPFMGTAISFALTQPPAVAFLVFTFLALGMASPYMLLCLFPGALRFVPKPGKWMIWLKVVLGFILLACVFWLGWVLGLQKGISAVIVLSLGLWLMAIGLWLWGFRSLDRKNNFVAVLIAGLVVIGLVVAIGGINVLPQKLGIETGTQSTVNYSNEGLSWQEFSPELLEQLRAQKKPVFIDFTAAWCLTCQVNDRLVFQNKKVVAEFENLGIIALKADWTNHSEVITKALAGYGKNSIPLYVLYGNENDKAILLPELVTPDIVITTLHKHIKN